MRINFTEIEEFLRVIGLCILIHHYHSLFPLYSATSPNVEFSSGERVLDPICRLLPDVGPCRAAQSRWFYDTSSRKCEEFIYGGCRGNENNFATKEACEAKCGENSPGRYPQAPQESPNNDNNPDNVDTSICHLPFEKGMCMMHFQRWGFDPNSGRCVQFAYGGCGGNENNFETKEACEQICLGKYPRFLTDKILFHFSNPIQILRLNESNVLL
ncbi:unnamed protein product, partial [Hymenolepis diminuta]